MNEDTRKQNMMLDILQQDVALESLPAGVWYQPRCFWDIQQVRTGPSLSAGAPNARFTFAKSGFTNGTRWPALVKRFVFAAIGYPLARPDPVAMGLVNATDFGECLINRASIQFSVRGRSNYSYYQIPGSNYLPKPNAQPATQNPNVSSLYGASYLEFDKPLIVGQDQACEWELATLQGMRWTNPGGLGAAAPFNLPTTPLPATMSYYERGGLFSGDARSVRTQILTTASADLPSPNEGFPYPFPQGFGPVVPAGARLPWWNGISKFNVREFKRHEATRQGSSAIYGMMLNIDQIDYDDFLLDPARFPAAQISQVSTRLGCRARVADGPNNDWWWTPGAPVALVFDTITPAVVYELPQPIALGRGDSVEVTITLPNGTLTEATPPPGGFPGPSIAASAYQVGIAMNGYAAVEG